MTQIHRDLEVMARLLREAVDRPEQKDLVGDTLPRVDRIVLYIDDLDRCPPERVVEVLEVVQLLLALPLFVVVVAVDPRWLLRSLIHHYEGMFSGTIGSAEELWSSTPMQYLEKIFQVPFTLAPVAAGGYQRLIEWLSGPQFGEPTVRSAVEREVPQAETDHTSAHPASRNLWRPVVARLPSAEIVEQTDPLAFTTEERALLSLFGPPLIATPRSIKRLVNSYGLLNALHSDQRPYNLSEHIDQGMGSGWYPYRAALVLLAILVGAPAESPVLFTHIHHLNKSNPAATWEMLLKEVETRAQEVPNEHESRGATNDSRRDRLQEVISAIRSIGILAEREGLPLPEPLRAWAAWILPVGRLSFETGRTVLRLAETDAAEIRISKQNRVNNGRRDRTL